MIYQMRTSTDCGPAALAAATGDRVLLHMGDGGAPRSFFHDAFRMLYSGGAPACAYVVGEGDVPRLAWYKRLWLAITRAPVEVVLMKRYCPTLLLAALLAWAIFAAVAWGGGPDDPFAPIGVRPGAVSSTDVYTGTGTGSGVDKYAYYHPDNYTYDYSGTSVVAEPVSGRDLSQADGAKAPLLQSRGGHNCWYIHSADDYLAGTEGGWPNIETLATCTVIAKFELASETTSIPGQYTYWSFTRSNGYYVAGLQSYYASDNAVSAWQIYFDDWTGFGVSPLTTVALGVGPVRVVSEVDWSTGSGRAWSYGDDCAQLSALTNTFSTSKHVYASNNFRLGKPADSPVPRAWIYWVKIYNRILTDSERLAEIAD